jgi:hypothetical protein
MHMRMERVTELDTSGTMRESESSPPEQWLDARILSQDTLARSASTVMGEFATRDYVYAVPPRGEPYVARMAISYVLDVCARPPALCGLGPGRIDSRTSSLFRDSLNRS